MMKNFILIFLSAIFCTSTFAQNKNLLPQFKVEHWDTKNGLPNDLILTLHQSKDGFLWMTSYSGLTRFDGVNFTAFNSRNVPEMKTDKVGVMWETEDSTLWFPTESSGLLSYKNGVFKSYLKKFYNLQFIAQSKNNELLFYTGDINNRLILFNIKSDSYKKLDEATVEQYLKDGKLFSKNSTDRSGNQWRKASGKPVIYGGGKMQALSLEQGVIPDTRYYEPYVDKKDRVWFTTGKGLFIWNGHSFVTYPAMEKPFIYLGDIQSGLVLEDHKGGIWVCNTGGVAYLQPGAERFVFLPPNYFTGVQNIKNIIEDREGNIWIASETGLLKLSYSKFLNYSKEEGLSNNRVSGVTGVDSTRYLVASMGQLFWIDNGVIHPYQAKTPELAHLASEIYFLYKDSKQNIWVLGAKTFKITSTTEKLIKSKGQVRFAYEDAQKKLWFAIAFSGIGFLNDKDEIELLKFPGIDFKTLYISSIRKLANGNWLVTTYNKGMLLIDNAGKPTFFSDTPGLPTIVVFKSYEDADGTVWLVTNMGISRYKNGTLSNISFKDGLPENSLFDFLPDHKGYVWFPSSRGLIRALKQELTDYLDKKINKINWQLYDDGDGMRNRQCVGSRHSAITPDGKILVPTFGGLVVIDPDKLTTNTVPPNVVIHRVLRDDKTIDLNVNNIFEPGNHRYIFQYSGLSFVAPEKVQFKFKLIGYDKDWITAVGDRKAFYTNLPAGKYTFQVIASNNDGVWNETGAAYSFTVKPFFYETAWFRILVAVALLFLVWIVVRWRTQAARKQNEILEAQVAARTQALNAERNSLEKTLGELKTTQVQLIQSEKMASLGELTAGIAHEIQNPLNFVNNFSEVSTELVDEMNEEMDKGNMEDAKLIANDLKQNLEKINHHGKRAGDIVKGMLQHSRSSSGVKEPTNINALADEYLRLAYHGLRAKDKSFNATMKTDFDETIGNINIIPQDIGRVILNLITNAFYVVNEKTLSAVATPTAVKYEPTVSVSTKKIGDKVEVSVKDNGNGIPQKILDKIFQPFFTTKPTGQGTGLGLSLSYDIVKAHGGELKVKTMEGEGSEFIVELPLNK